MGQKDAKLTQCEKIIKYIKLHGSITQLEALQELGCMRLASRISQLNKEGYCIIKTMEKFTNNAGEVKRYARYRLAGEEDV